MERPLIFLRLSINVMTIAEYGANDESENSHHQRKPLDDQTTINKHLMHELLRIYEHKGTTVGSIFAQLNGLKHYKKTLKPPLKATKG